MSVLVVGVNHRTAGLDLLERLAVPADEISKALVSLTGLEHVLEAVVLSTCNRVEVYAHVTRFHPGLQEVRTWLAERGDIHPQDLDDLQYSFYDDRAAAHLFAVASGVDSMVVGERQIALQVKQVARQAAEEGAAKRVLQKLFREAVRVGRRVRAETEIGQGASSMVDIGLDVVRERVGGSLADLTVLVAGAGKMGGLTADRLVAEGTRDVLVWNRSDDKAERLAVRVGGRIEADLTAAVARADIVVCTTGAPLPIIDLDLVNAALSGRDRPLVLLDLAVPRNVAAAVGADPRVVVVDVEDVRAATQAGPTGIAVAAAQVIVDEEADRFHGWTRGVQIDPTIRALRERADQVRLAELERAAGRLGDLDDKQRAAVDALARGIVNTLMHAPSVRLRELADHGGAEHYANALRELFDLDE